MKLEDRILRLARLGMTPYQIEEQLGIKHFTIHIEYHAVLMQGYSDTDSYFERTAGEQLSGPVSDQFRMIKRRRRRKEPLTEEQRIEQQKAYQAAYRAKNAEKRRRYYRTHKAEILASQKRRRAEKRRKENETTGQEKS